MIPRIAREVFRKDGIELLRDRRTIFVNVALPVLLYPVLMLFALQVMQLTRLTEDNLPGVALVETDALLVELATHQIDPDPAYPDAEGGASTDPAADNTEPVGTAGNRDALDEPSSTDAASADSTPSSDNQAEAEQPATITLPPYQLDTLEPDAAAALREAAEALPRRAELADELAALTSPNGTDAKALRDQISAIDVRLLDLLREYDLVAALIGAPVVEGQPQRLAVVFDQAHRHASRVAPALETLLEQYQDQLLERNLIAAGLSAHLANPLDLQRVEAAPASETFRVRLAAIIPLLLVFMALSGAFYPALDLIAGERERGTLETLLSWPGDRRAIFTGKLLVVVTAAVVSVILNLASLGLTVVLAGSGIAGGAAMGDLAGGFALGAGVLALGFIALLPLVVTLSALSLALSGLAASYKEAQNYLSPLFLVVMAPAVVVMIPTVEPSWQLDIIPILGPLLSLKEALLSASLPVGHLLVATAASTALAVVVVGWSVRLLDSERFLYPGLVRAGWGRFRKWGVGEPMPGGLEAIGVYAAATGAFLLLGPQLAQFGPVVQVGGPLVIGVFLPVLIHLWLGAYRVTAVLPLAAPSAGDWTRSLLLIPLGMLLSLGIGLFQGAILGEPPEITGMGDIFAQIMEIGGLPLLILLVAVLPAVTEEALLRGSVLTGLRRGLGNRSAILVSAFCFAALHASPWRFLPQFALGLILALMVIRSGSLWTVILIHFGHNAGIILLEYADIGEIDVSPWAALSVAAAAGAACTVLVWPRSDKTKPALETPGSDEPAAQAAPSDAKQAEHEA